MRIDQLQRSVRSRTGRDTDAGSVLPMVLVLMVVGSLIVVALLNFAVVLFRTQPVLAERDDTYMSARSAMEMAIVFQRAEGPASCYTATTSSTFTINGAAATVSCSPAGGYYGTARNKLGAITTSTDPLTALSGAAAAQIAGDVFVTGLDPADPRQWFDLVGDDPEGDGIHDFPTLPPLPGASRGSIEPPQLGSCSLYFPGRYDDPLTLAAGNHYFTSGVYYFDDVVTLQTGARAVAGQGPTGGCAGGDAPAAGASSAPSTSNITGRGATFLFGGDGRLVINNATLYMNRRVSDSTTRGTDGVSIRTINFGRAAAAEVPAIPADPLAVPPTLEIPAVPAVSAIPADVVFISDTHDADPSSSCNPTLSTERCLQAVADHAPGGAAYEPSTLTPEPATPILDIDQTLATTPASANTVVIDGTALAPNARIVIDADSNGAHKLRVTGGLIADSIELGHENPSSSYVVGVIDQAVQRRFALVVNVVSPGGSPATSEAVLDVNADGNYAINAWSVDT